MSKRKNLGKVFEAEFKDSLPDGWYVERYKDDTAGFYGVTNPADYRIYKFPHLILVELKTHRGKSLPLDKIRDNQIKGLLKAVQYKGVYGGFIINFRDLEETYYVPVDLVEHFRRTSDRKSILVEWCRDNGERIGQELKRVRYRYNLKDWLRRY